MKPLLETIDTRFGTASKHAFSRGNTLPYTGVPFGMNYFVPQTSDQDGSWFFDPHLPIFQGIRLTHQPSPWIGDYSWLLLTPVTSQLGGDSLFHRQSSYDRDKASFQPHYLKIFSLRYQIETQLTPTCYGASIRLKQKQGKALSLYLHATDELTVEQVDKRTLALRQEGKTETNKNSLTMFTALQMNTDILAISQEAGDWRIDLVSSQTEMQLATSFISPSQALINLPQEDFDSCKSSAQADWENLLHRFDIIETGGADRTFFDHCLYRLFLFPQTFYEVDESGQAIHMDLATGTVKPGVLFSNNGFWDTFRTTFPLFALIIPEHYQRFLEGFLNSYRDTGFLPKWLAPDERGMMPGTLLDGIIADSACKDMAPDLEGELFQAMLETASKADPLGINGRHGLAQYQELGYLSTDHHESVSHTLDYAYSDFCIANCAKKLKNIEIAETYKAASQNYRQLFDAETGYMRARDNQGNFHPDFSPYSWGRDYAECSAIQATLGVLHDIPGLIQLMGGKETFSNYLLKACQDAPLFETTGYGYEIHEMSEMATAPFGQIAISNQPSFHIPYLFRYSDYPDYTALLIKTLRQKAFQPSWEAYPGDEDNGSLSAWYIWSALGFYPTCPGKPSYDLGIPLFDHLRVYLAKEDKWLDIHTKQNHNHFNFVKECRLDKTLVSTIQHQDLLKAEQLTFTLSWLPSH
ncbi:GH92 family glycosyl hydrolase [Streptococcus pneumoniae]|uniref:GH92 family glycosyl hydrolase n=1 Tax=Streptococcus pneumoniae TaxID=1313 RepID=UPI000766B234|nr:GH92 family glycosyl hydrolase [Streptococcus pneumoniae]CWG30398.1 sugar hydrolase [Streptococcus pneumoniae]CWH63074.1 sugar hydrolase [Streptococcus pneumoniae]VOS39957.1 sugar hydrolase [Streptococcus pneumoniae]VOU53830.1 sugar hydrolase [Streptococcus pneumoniae]VQD38986.1 sugar hydrolase [Streptococcus pneumoniae]